MEVSRCMVASSLAIGACGLRAPPPCRAALLWSGLVSTVYWSIPVETAEISPLLALDILSAIVAAAAVLRHAHIPREAAPFVAAGAALNAASWTLGRHGPTPVQRAAHLGFHLCVLACLLRVRYHV